MEMKCTRFEKTVALLELTASQRPELIEFQVEAISSPWHGLPVDELSSAFQSRPEHVSRTVLEACRDLDRLEKAKDAWQDPRQVLERPNLAALQIVCQARLSRVPGLVHRRRLAVIRRKLSKAQELARVRDLIEDFIGVGSATTDAIPEPSGSADAINGRRRAQPSRRRLLG